MKKVFACLLLVSLLLTLVGCASCQENKQPFTNMNASNATPTTVPTSAPTTQPTTTPTTRPTTPIVLPTAPDTDPSEFEYKPADIPQEYWAVLNNEQKIFFSESEELLIDDYVFLENHDEIKNCSDVVYALVTSMGGEIMLAIRHEDSILMLCANNGVVFGKNYNFRGMDKLCNNGAYSWNDTDIDGHHYGQNVLVFADNKITASRLWQIDNDGTENAKYYIGDKEVTNTEILEYFNGRNDVEVSWMPMTRYPISEKAPAGG